ncbi:DUF3040 domain-containing protein [Allonocardiopsis opalescens]|uniref:DUF3040 family protein n=1 Tax=Allonocardiopsis opalescens TaxID=1144618 RepID=A0A2T0Q4N9_9ACTN|nr:DUF3040 domain-containing protein [Allonocardiopsis opalescens]PRX98785.1 Protein of unknown function (DUF3040) [Allonocardiopsis opalescens]
MALSMDEQRRLAEIEQQLARQDPQLARFLAEFDGDRPAEARPAAPPPREARAQGWAAWAALGVLVVAVVAALLATAPRTAAPPPAEPAASPTATAAPPGTAAPAPSAAP